MTSNMPHRQTSKSDTAPAVSATPVAPDAGGHRSSLTSTAASRKESKGIGGWLIFPALGAVLSPILIATGTFKLVPLLSDLSADANSAAKAYVFGSLLVNGLMFVAWIYANGLLWTRRAKFPAIFNALLLVTVALEAANLTIASVVFQAQLVSQDLQNFGRDLVLAAVLISYMLQSKRVKNTFVS
jgi:Protein of unknown function (DUF2569)